MDTFSLEKEKMLKKGKRENCRTVLVSKTTGKIYPF